MKRQLLIFFFFFTITKIVAQEGAIYNKWYLNELNVRGENIEIPNSRYLQGDGLLSPVTYGKDVVFPELGDVTKFHFKAGGCATLNLLGNVTDNGKFEILQFGGIGSICTQEVYNFVENYNLSFEQTAFYNASKFFQGDGGERDLYLLYSIEEEGKKLRMINKNGEFAIYSLIPFDLLSTKNLDKESSKFNVYPNPIDTSFKVKLPNNFDVKKTSLTIINTAAVIVREFKVTSNDYNISNLPKGVYILIADDGTNVLTTKIIKK